MVCTGWEADEVDLLAGRVARAVDTTIPPPGCSFSGSATDPSGLLPGMVVVDDPLYLIASSQEGTEKVLLAH